MNKHTDTQVKLTKLFEQTLITHTSIGKNILQ